MPRTEIRLPPCKDKPFAAAFWMRFADERRNREAGRENDGEPDPPHDAPRWRMAGGSLAERRDVHQRGDDSCESELAALVEHALTRSVGPPAAAVTGGS